MGKSVGGKRPPAGAAAGKGRGKGPAKGAEGAGRPSAAYRDEARRLLNSQGAKASVKAILEDPKNKNFAPLFRFLHERAFGREPLSAELKVPSTLTIRVVREDRR